MSPTPRSAGNVPRILRNILILASSQVTTWALSAGYLVLLGRYLGPSGLGEFTFASAIGSLLVLVIELGMNALVRRSVAREPERMGTVVSAAVVTRLGLSFLVPGALVAYAFVTHLSRGLTFVAFVVVTGAIVGSFTTLFQAAWQGREKMGFMAASSIIQNVFVLGLAAVVMALRGGVLGIAASSTIAMLGVLAWNVWWARRFVRLTWRVGREAVRDMVVGSLSFWANGLFLTFYSYIDSIILASMAGNRAVGFYSPPSRIYGVALFAPTILGYATTPLLSRLGVHRGSSFEQAGRKTLSLLIVSAVPLTIGIILGAAPIISVLFGPAYGPAVPVLVALSICIPLTYLNIGFYQLLAASDRQALWSPIMAAGCIVNPLSNVILIRLAQQHWHDAAIGAALSLALTEGIMAIYGAVLLRRVIACSAIGRAVLGSLAAGAAQAALLRLIGTHSITLAIVAEALGAVLYIVLAFACGALPRGDFEMLWTMARRRLPAAV